jgi:hypothetical protein
MLYVYLVFVNWLKTKQYTVHIMADHFENMDFLLKWNGNVDSVEACTGVTIVHYLPDVLYI